MKTQEKDTEEMQKKALRALVREVFLAGYRHGFSLGTTQADSDMSDKEVKAAALSAFLLFERQLQHFLDSMEAMEKTHDTIQ